MYAPRLLSRTFNRNCTLSQTLFNTSGLIILHSRLVLSSRSFLEATGVAHTFSFKWLHKKNHKESNQVNEVATRLAPFQSNFRASYRPNTFSHEMNNMQAHHPGEKCNRLLSTLNVGRHVELTCFCSSRRWHFKFGRSMGRWPFLLNIHTTPWCSEYVKMFVMLQLGVLYSKFLHFVCWQTCLSGKCAHRKSHLW